MATNMCSTRPTPRFVIETCPSDGTEELIKRRKISPSFSRSISLPNYDQAYKDLSGAIHRSSFNRLKNFFIRSQSCPTNDQLSLTKQEVSHSPSPSTTVHFSMNLLDPRHGTQSPGGSSSRYSLYGSFFDLSESGCHPTLIKLDSQLTIGGRPLLITDNSPRLSTYTYEDKCSNWLSHLGTM